MVWMGRRQVEGFVDGRRDGGMAQLGSAVVPKRARITWSGEDGAPDMVANFEVRDGRPECTDVQIVASANGRGVRTSDLREIHVDELTASVFAELALFGVEDEAEQRAAVRDVREARMARRGTVTREELQAIADFYRQNIDGNPTEAVQRRFGLSHRTASRRIERARSEGLLPKTSPGKRKA